MKKLKKAELIALCEAYEQVIIEAADDLADGLGNADIYYNIHKSMERIELEFFGEVM